MYAKRNSITLALLLAIVTAIGLFWLSRESKKLEQIIVQNKELEKKFEGSREVAQTFEIIEKEYEKLKKKWDEAPKKILSAEEPAMTVSYINWLTNENKLLLDFDFVLNNISKSADISHFRFTLTGEGKYHDVYDFIWYLTQNPLLYQIEDFILNRKPNEKDILNFKVQAVGFFMDAKWEMKQEFNFANIEPLSTSRQFHDVFQSMLVRPVKTYRAYTPRKIDVPVIDASLPDIDQASLQAIANGTIYLRTKNKGLVTLVIGDAVRNGRLLNINKEKSEAIFAVSQNGVEKQVRIGLDYRK